MKITALILSAIVLAAAGSSPARAQQCPVGSFPSLDTFGNRICKRFADGSTSVTETPPNQACPNGAFPAMDNFGNKVCRTMGAGNKLPTDTYDTSKGCPIGTMPFVDNFGNKVCKRL